MPEKKNNLNLSYKSKGMSLAVKTVTRLSVGMLLLYGVNMTLHGHMIPGGGFAAGIFIALAFLNLILAFGKDPAKERLNQRRMAIIMGLGLILFLFIGMLGFGKGFFFADFFKNNTGFFSILGGKNIPFYNIAISLQVSSGLLTIFLCLTLLKIKGE
ncbi:MAG: hypothetical protein HY810_09435 [Candidatus Omnitrophica bacterium]|nr:hypothetical protein [Candidatus Omnitrophota bacterium]